MSLDVQSLVAGNWKMNGTSETLSEIRAIVAGLETRTIRSFDALLCLPATLLSRATEVVKNGNLMLGAEDCHIADSGAHTGDISAPMLKDAGADYVILGHSERRTDHDETNEVVRVKTKAAWRAGLTAIVCVGETLQERESHRTLDVIAHQCQASIPDAVSVAQLVIAYEPVWAIGSGITPTEEDVAKAHAFLRNSLCTRFGDEGNKIRLLYGGSVNPDNAAVLLGIPHVNGALIGKASLRAADFLEICHHAYDKL
ncbi:MAG: triosephosphate isomerase (TIM) [Candidatus Tokpelaia sp. JSC188]|nr:MAG: triosephosphate isomerase (TIM) [Candidatus Tokpelaia sp. JSC188]